MSRLQPPSVNRPQSKKPPVFKEISPAGLRWRLSLGLLFLVGSIIFAGAQWKERQDYEANLAALNSPAALVTNASVIKKEITTTKNGGKLCYLTYQFQLTSSPSGYFRAANVTCSLYESLNEGDLTPVRYLPQNPAFSRLEKDPTDTLEFQGFEFRLGLTALIDLFVLYYLFWIFWVNRQARQRKIQ